MNNQTAILYTKRRLLRVVVKELAYAKTMINFLDNTYLIAQPFDEVVMNLCNDGHRIVNFSDDAQLIRFHPDIIKNLV